MAGTKRSTNPFRRAVRIVRVRPRLFLSALVGLLVAVLWPATFHGATRILFGWDVGVALYLVLALRLMATTDIDGIRRHAARQDEGRTAVLFLTAVAGLASLGAIIAELGGANKAPGHLALAAVTILLSWIFTHTIFALHYAYEYYGEARHGRGGGLNFPGDEPPDYWDFLYFSLVIGMTSQVSDVAITSNKIRRMATGHGVVSFVFNATLLALTVNIAASLI
jgi:uncharacterized membrane protein